MVQPNFSAFNKWKKGWVAEFLEKKHQSMIRGQNCVTQLRDGPLHWVMVIADFSENLEDWLTLEYLHNT